MSIMRGKDGVVSVGANAVAELTDWTLNIEATDIDKTVIGKEWKEAVQGSRGWNATVNGFIDLGDTNGQRAVVNEVLVDDTDGYLADVRFEADDGTADGYFYGSAVITGVSINNPGNDQIEKVTLTLRGHGKLYYVDAT